MSAPEAKLSYDMEIKMGKKQPQYHQLLQLMPNSKITGIVVVFYNFSKFIVSSFLMSSKFLQ